VLIVALVGDSVILGLEFIRKLLVTVAAGNVIESPAWLAAIVQVPTLTAVTVVPLTVQTEGVVELSETESAGGVTGVAEIVQVEQELLVLADVEVVRYVIVHGEDDEAEITVAPGLGVTRVAPVKAVIASPMANGLLE
jgi:hypothetical protein